MRRMCQVLENDRNMIKKIASKAHIMTKKLYSLFHTATDSVTDSFERFLLHRSIFAPLFSMAFKTQTICFFPLLLLCKTLLKYNAEKKCDPELRSCVVLCINFQATLLCSMLFSS